MMKGYFILIAIIWTAFWGFVIIELPEERTFGGGVLFAGYLLWWGMYAMLKRQ